MKKTVGSSERSAETKHSIKLNTHTYITYKLPSPNNQWSQWNSHSPV